MKLLALIRLPVDQSLPVLVVLCSEATRPLLWMITHAFLVCDDVVPLLGPRDLRDGQRFSLHVSKIHIDGESRWQSSYALSAMMWSKAPSLRTSPSSSRFSASLKKLLVVWSSRTPEYSTYMFLFYLSLLASSLIAPIFDHRWDTFSMLSLVRPKSIVSVDFERVFRISSSACLSFWL